MIEGEPDAATFHQRAWQRRGVIVSLDKQEALECLTANTRDGYVEFLQWFERPVQTCGWRTVRAVGKVEIKFATPEAQAKYKAWLRK